MVANFNDAAITDVIGRINSFAEETGRFDSVSGHEPKNAPGHGITCATWVQRISPMPRGSGQSMTSGVLLLNTRLYTSFIQQPYDLIDPNLTAATTDLMGSFSGDFELGGADNVRAIDLLGMSGTALDASAGYLEMDRTMYRIFTITVPVIINDMFLQVP